MKIVAILGSPHGMKGNTAKLLGETIRAAEKAGATVTTLSLAELKVEPCRGCDVCHKTGTCGRKDDFVKIKKAMEQSDGIILATPNYIFHVSAQLKALLDRCCGPLHLQHMDGKYGAAVVTSGGGGDEEILQYMQRFLRTLGCWTVGGVASPAHQLGDPKVVIAAADLGTRLAQAIQQKEKFPDQAKERADFFARMKYVVSSRKEEWAYEYEYWKAQGRL